MQDYAEALAKELEVLLAHVDTVDKNAAALDVVEAHHQAGDGGLAGAGVADDGGGLIGFDGEADAHEDPFDVGVAAKFGVSCGDDTRLLGGIELLIGEPDVAEFDASRTVAGDGIWGRDDLGLGVEELEDALAGGHGSLEDVVFFAKVLDGAEEALGVLDEGDEDAEGYGAKKAGVHDVAALRQIGVRGEPLEVLGVEDADAAAPDDESDGGGTEELDDGIVERVGEDCVGPGLLVLGVDGGEGVEGAAFAIEELHYGHAGDVLLREGVDARGGGALAAVAVAYVAAEDAGDEEDGWDDGEGEQGERPAHPQHDDDDEGEDEDVLEDGEDAGGEHLVEGVDVGGDAGDEFAYGIVIEEGRRHALQMAEDLAAQVEHDLLPGPLHHVGLQKFEKKGDEKGAKVEERDLGDACNGLRIEMPGQPGELVVGRIGHVGVDGDFDQIRSHDIAGGLDENGEG